MKRFKKLMASILALAVVTTSALAMAVTPANAAGKEVTIYYQNTQNWNNVYAYIWAGSGNVKGTAAWPGAKMSKVAGTSNWYALRYTSGVPFNVIFNDNAQPKPQQTANHKPANLAADKSAYWFVPTGSKEGNSNGLTPAGTAITVYSSPKDGFPKPAAATADTGDKKKEAKPAGTVSKDVTSSAAKDASPATGDAQGNVPIAVGAAAVLALAGMGVVFIRKQTRA